MTQFIVDCCPKIKLNDTLFVRKYCKYCPFMVQIISIKSPPVCFNWKLKIFHISISNWCPAGIRSRPYFVLNLHFTNLRDSLRTRSLSTTICRRHAALRHCQQTQPSSQYPKLELCLLSLHTWFCLNGLALNPDKSDTIFLALHSVRTLFPAHQHQCGWCHSSNLVRS